MQVVRCVMGIRETLLLTGRPGTHQTGWNDLEVVPSFPLYCQTAE